MVEKNHLDRSIFYKDLLQYYRSFLQSLGEDLLSNVAFDDFITCGKNVSLLSPEEIDFHRNLHIMLMNLHKRMFDLHWMKEHLQVLHDLGQTFTKTFNLEEIYQKAYELVSRVMDTDAFVISLYNEGDEEIYIPYCIDNGIFYPSTTLKFGEGFISRVILTREPIHVRTDDEANQYDHVRWGNPERNTNTAIFVPMLLGNNIKGVISAQSYREFAYRDEHVDLLKIIGNQVASAIETARLYDRVYELSIKDDLTHLKNSRAFHQNLEQLIEQNQMVTLIMLDSDNLKRVNDQYGHHVGDQLIQRVAEAIISAIQDGEEAYRYAGDEFMVIAPKISIEVAKERVIRIQQYLSEHPLRSAEHDIPISVSAGIAVYPDHANSADALKRVADEALYASKHNGKNSCTVYHHEMMHYKA